MGPFRGPYRGSPLRDPCWWAVIAEVAAHWEEVLMGPFRGGTHTRHHLSLAGDHALELQTGRRLLVVLRHGEFSDLLHVRVADILDRTPATDENLRPSGGDSVEDEESGGQEEEKTELPQRHRRRFSTRISFSGRAVNR